MRLEERASTTGQRKFSRDEALAKLANKYFTSHGPAQLRDFSWWSGLSAKDSNEGLEMIKSKFVQENVNGKTYLMPNNSKSISDPQKIKNKAFLLSIYDEYTIAYKDRSDLSKERYVEKLITMGNALTAVIILDGQIIGTWKRMIHKGTVKVKTNLFRKLNKTEQKLLEKAETSYQSFLSTEEARLYGGRVRKPGL